MNSNELPQTLLSEGVFVEVDVLGHDMRSPAPQGHVTGAVGLVSPSVFFEDWYVAISTDSRL